MAFFKSNKQELEMLNQEIRKLNGEIDVLISMNEELKVENDNLEMKLLNHKKYIDDLKVFIDKYEELLVENRDLKRILNNPKRSSKATIDNLKLISDYKGKGCSYREISKLICEATGEELSHSTVRYLYKKYLENDV